MTGQPLRKALWGCRRVVVVAAFFSLIINLLMLTAPIYMLQVFDRVLQSRSIDTLIFLSMAALVALFTLALLDGLRSFLFLRLAEWLERFLGGDLLAINIKGALHRDKQSSAQSLRDLLTLRTFLTSPGMSSILDSPWTPVFLLVIFSLHTTLGWLSLFGALSLAALALINEVATRGVLMQAGNSQIQSEYLAEAALRNADAVEAMGMRAGVIAQWRRISEIALADQQRAGRRGAIITATSKFLRFSLQVAILGVGALLVLQNELTAGGMIAASILMGRALAPLDSAISSWRAALRARAAAERVKTLLRNAPAEDDQAMALPTPQGKLAVQDLVFGYPGSGGPLLKGLSFTLEPGEALGVIGPSASGKTTLARLLVGNLQPQRGAARLDGADMYHWSSADRGQYVGYLPQDVELFKGTIQQNIARMGEVNHEAVIAAAQTAGVHEIILGLPNGYETDIGDAGAVLSGGQRQRVALARAVYGGPKFLVLDEPNASLDHIGEEALIKALATLKAAGVTQVVISHRPSILRQVDKILVMQDGKIQAMGPRDKIIAEMTRGRVPPPAEVRGKVVDIDAETGEAEAGDD